MNSNQIDWIAIYAAIVATAVLIWDIVKWKRSGPRVRFSTQTGMRTVGAGGFDGRDLVSMTVVNVGDGSTTITSIGFLYYKGWWDFLRRRSTKAFVIPKPSDSQPLPFELRPGVVWHGLCTQDSEVEEMAKNGRLYCVVYLSHQRKGISDRVRVNQR